MATVADDGKSLAGAPARFRAARFLVRPLDLEVGPDGNLYVLEYSGWFGPGADTRIARVEYTGDCRPADIVPPSIGVLEGKAARRAARPGILMRLSGSMGFAMPAGMRALEVHGLDGRRLLSLPGRGQVALPAGFREGLYLVRYRP